MKIVFMTLSALGFFFTLGSVGALECNNVSLLQGAVQALIGLAVCIGFGSLLGERGR